MVLDLETTGLDPRRDRVIAIGAVRIRGGMPRPDDTFAALVHPERPIPPASTRIHGITDADVAASPPLREVLPAFRAYVGAAVPVSYVAAFDLGFLARPLTQAGLPPLTRALDPALLARALLPALPDTLLETLAARFEVPLTGRHTALGDALIAARVLLALLPLLEARGVTTVGDALRFQQGDAARASRHAYAPRTWS